MRVIIIISAFTFFVACSSENTDQNTLFDKFSSTFPIIFTDTVIVKPNYDTLDNLTMIDTSFYELFDTAFKNNLVGELSSYFKFKIDKTKEGLIVTNSATGGMLESFLFIANSMTKKIKYIDRVSKFYELHNIGDYLQTKITIIKDTLLLKKDYSYCNFLIDPENPDCKESQELNKVTIGKK